MSNVNSQKAYHQRALRFLWQRNKNLQDCHDCVLDVLNQDTTTTVAVRRSTQQQQTFFYYISCCDLSWPMCTKEVPQPVQNWANRNKQEFFIHFEPPSDQCSLYLPIGVCISVFKFGGIKNQKSPDKPKDIKKQVLFRSDDGI